MEFLSEPEPDRPVHRRCAWPAACSPASRRASSATLLNALVVVVAFVIASQLRDPLYDVLSFWQAFTAELRVLIIFLVLFIGLVIGGWFVVRAFYRRTPAADRQAAG